MFGFLKQKIPGPHSAHFVRQGVTVKVTAEQTLLQAALAAGLPYPHNCRVGSCTTCKCRLLEGPIRALTDTSYVLDAKERKAGAILACQTRLLGDVRIDIEWPATEQERTPISGTVTAVQPLTADIVDVRIELQTPLSYTAGQYAQILVPSLDITRSYSFADAPSGNSQTSLRFFIRHVPGGIFTGWLQKGCIGEAVQVQGAFGSFALSQGSGPMLFIAGGSGLAPVRALLEQIALDGQPRDAVFLYGARTSRDLYALDEVKAITERWTGRFHFEPVLSEEPTGSSWRGATGMVTDHLDVRVSDLAAREAYLCGPPAMVDAAVHVLRANGVPVGAIRTDRFVASGG